MKSDSTNPSDFTIIDLQKFSLKIKFNDKEEIEIFFSERQQKKQYELYIDADLMNQNPSLEAIFDTPQRLYKYIISNSNQVKFSQDGIFQISIMIYDKQKTISLKTKQKRKNIGQIFEKYMNDLRIQSNKKIHILCQDFDKKLDQKVSIWQYQQFNQIMIDRIKQQKKQVMDKMSQFIDVQQKTKKQKPYISNQSNIPKQQQLAQKDIKVQVQNNLLNIVQKKGNQQQNECIDYKENQQKNKQLRNSQKYEKYNSSNHNFFINLKANSHNHRNFKCVLAQYTYKLQISFKFKKSRCIYFVPHVIQPGKITSLKVKQLKSVNNQIIYGIVTQSQINSYSSYYHYHGMGYRAQSGKVYDNWQQLDRLCSDVPDKLCGEVVTDGSIVTIIADMIDNTVSWSVNGYNLKCSRKNCILQYSYLIKMIKQKYSFLDKKK